MELWKPITGYEGLYEVSNYGNIKSLRLGRNMCLRSNGAGSSVGYSQVALVKNGSAKQFLVHRLVMGEFMGYEKYLVDHIDGDPANNRLDNLRYVTSRENLTNGYRIDREKMSSQFPGVSWSKQAKKWQSCISHNGKLKHLGYYRDEFQAHEAYLEARYDIEQSTLCAKKDS